MEAPNPKRGDNFAQGSETLKGPQNPPKRTKYDHKTIKAERGFYVAGVDLNPRPRGYEPRELPGCSTPR